MSLDATIWAWKQKVRPSLKLTLLALADRADETHTCYPSIERLEHDTGLNRKTVMGNLRELAGPDYGLVEINKRKNDKGQHMRNIYTLIGVENRHEPSRIVQDRPGSSEVVHPGPKSGTRDKNQVDETSHTQVPLSAKTTSQKWDTNLPVNLLINTECDPSKIDMDGWSDFVKHRIEINKPLSDMGAKRAYKLLVKLPMDKQVECIDQSIISGYQGLFPGRINGVNTNAINRQNSRPGNGIDLESTDW